MRNFGSRTQHQVRGGEGRWQGGKLGEVGGLGEEGEEEGVGRAVGCGGGGVGAWEEEEQPGAEGEEMEEEAPGNGEEDKKSN